MVMKFSYPFLSFVRGDLSFKRNYDLLNVVIKISQLKLFNFPSRKDQTITIIVIHDFSKASLLIKFYSE